MNEVELTKKTINLKLPIQIGFFVYQYAKLRMLQFYFDLLVIFIHISDFGDQNKVSCKGLNKNTNAISKERYLSVLTSKKGWGWDKSRV